MSSPATDASRAGGVIYDIGYRHYEGERRGRLAVVAALYWQGVRTIFGIGRGERAKLVPLGLFAISLLPAIMQAGVTGIAGNAANLVPHDRYFVMTSVLIALFCAAQAPELMGGDRQQRVLTLYFSRAVRRIDYVLARWLSLVSSLFVIMIIPQLVIFIARNMVDPDPWAAFAGDAHVLLPIAGSAFLIALLLGGLAVLLASLVPRRIYATAAIIGVLLASTAVSAAVVSLDRERFGHAVLASPLLTSEGVAIWMFDAVPRPRSIHGRASLEPRTYGLGAGAIALGALMLVVGVYRRVET
ncbi:MAG TPA: hypothetical protein VMM18_03040 [Gemmatimonadaceae bacterium]|nr:hypothetical protein [Gemmatimonadaceae bacterium]